MEFVCHVGTGEGRVLRQVRNAPDETTLRAELEREGLALLGFERRFAGVRRRGPGRVQRLPLDLLLVFSQELAALLRAGLPLLQSIGLLATRQRHTAFRRILADVEERVRSGSELSDAFSAHEEAFPALFASALKAGERTGDLEQVLQRMVRYFRLLLDARKKVYNALVYPAVLLGLSVAMLAVMSLFVVPRFRVFYEAMDLAELPLLTRIVLGSTAFLRAQLPIVLLALLVGGPIFLRWTRSAPGRLAMGRVRLAIPVLGPIFHRFAISEYSRSLSTLLSGGLPLVQALEISTRAVGNLWIRSRLEPAIGRVREGQSLAGALGETGEVPPIALDMTHVGETTGALDDMLAHVSEFLDEEVETRMGRLLSLLEPLLLVVVGGLVAILLISVYLPIFSALSRIQ